MELRRACKNRAEGLAAASGKVRNCQKGFGNCHPALSTTNSVQVMTLKRCQIFRNAEEWAWSSYCTKKQSREALVATTFKGSEAKDVSKRGYAELGK